MLFLLHSLPVTVLQHVATSSLAATASFVDGVAVAVAVALLLMATFQYIVHTWSCMLSLLYSLPVTVLQLVAIIRLAATTSFVDGVAVEFLLVATFAKHCTHMELHSLPVTVLQQLSLIHI